MSDDRIPMTPLEAGDEIHMAVEEHPTVLAGKPGDLVLIGVPSGRGLLLAAWFERMCLQTPEAELSRRHQDAVAELTETA